MIPFDEVIDTLVWGDLEQDSYENSDEFDAFDSPDSFDDCL